MTFTGTVLTAFLFAVQVQTQNLTLGQTAISIKNYSLFSDPKVNQPDLLNLPYGLLDVSISCLEGVSALHIRIPTASLELSLFSNGFFVVTVKNKVFRFKK